MESNHDSQLTAFQGFAPLLIEAAKRSNSRVIIDISLTVIVLFFGRPSRDRAGDGPRALGGQQGGPPHLPHPRQPGPKGETALIY